MVSALLQMVLGFVVLAWSADRLVSGAISIAESLRISPLIIGLTVVALGTSAPEIVVTIVAVLKDGGSLAVGNALGSNIANIGLVLGLSAVIAPVHVQNRMLKWEYPILVVVTALVGLLLWDLQLARYEGWILFAGLAGFLLYLWQQAKAHHKSLEEVAHKPERSSLWRGLFWMTFGLLLLILSSRFVVDKALWLAELWNISELVIGLTVVALGTSLPEVAVSVVGALRGQTDLVVGNILGSNLFNFLIVLAIPAVFGPIHLDETIFSRDFVVVMGLTLLLVVLSIPWKKGKSAGVGRLSGGVLIAVYTIYVSKLFI